MENEIFEIICEAIDNVALPDRVVNTIVEIKDYQQPVKWKDFVVVGSGVVCVSTTFVHCSEPFFETMVFMTYIDVNKVDEANNNVAEFVKYIDLNYELGFNRDTNIIESKASHKQAIDFLNNLNKNIVDITHR